MRPCAFAVLSLPLLLAGGCSLEEAMADDAADSTDAVAAVAYVTVTQGTCRVFEAAKNREVDRLWLESAARDEILKSRRTNDLDVAVGEVRGLKVERVSYLSSNQVEAVFSYQKTR